MISLAQDKKKENKAILTPVDFLKSVAAFTSRDLTSANHRTMLFGLLPIRVLLWRLVRV